MDKNRLLYLSAASLGLGVALLALKFVAWWWTNSNAILTDALESIINVVAGSFALYSLSLSMKPKDEDHPYGHGKIEFLSAGFEGALILIAGCIIIVKSVWDAFYPHGVAALDFGVGITALSGLANYLMGCLLVRQGRENNSLALEANGKHLNSDAYSSVGLVLGLGLVHYTGWFMLDNILAIIFGIVIIVTGCHLLRRSVAGIMDEADEALISAFVGKIDEHRMEDWIDIHNVRIIQYGQHLHLDCHITVPWYYDTRQSHDAMKAFEDKAKELSERPMELFVHVDPCEPQSCPVCTKKDCDKRLAAFEGRVRWALDNTTPNKKHG